MRHLWPAGVRLLSASSLRSGCVSLNALPCYVQPFVSLLDFQPTPDASIARVHRTASVSSDSASSATSSAWPSPNGGFSTTSSVWREHATGRFAGRSTAENSGPQCIRHLRDENAEFTAESQACMTDARSHYSSNRDGLIRIRGLLSDPSHQLRDFSRTSQLTFNSQRACTSPESRAESKLAAEPEQAGCSADKEVLYRGRGIIVFRVLVRLKIFQLFGAAGVAVVANTLLSGAPVEPMQVGVLSALVVGCGVASLSLWYFSRRYLGELSLPAAHPGHACFSVLDFWGNREDNLVRFEDIEPTMSALSPAAAADAAAQPFIPVRVKSQDRQYLLSWRHGHLVQKDRLRDLIEGRLAPSADALLGDDITSAPSQPQLPVRLSPARRTAGSTSQSNSHSDTAAV